jgi:hypothetical protein
MNSVTLTNDVGGTGELPVGLYRVEVVSSHRDSETGRWVRGRLLDPRDVEAARAAGTTGYTPGHYLKYAATNPDLYAGAVKAAAAFDPALVTFHADDFTPDAG